MFVSIDWLSFTFTMQARQEVMAFELWGRAANALALQYPHASDVLIAGYDWTPRVGRAPYNSAQQRADNGVMIFAHQALPHSLIEVGGIGMDTLGSLEAELELARSVTPTLTRIDIACDIYTPVRPDEFCGHRDAGRFKAWSEVVSASGHTIYVGSKHSDRYARVYRYNEPHPRAAFLRVEHVLKAEQAREAMSQVNVNGLDWLVAALGNTFGWQHPCWQPAENTDEAVKAWRPERRQGKTIAWIHGQVIPALLKLHRENVLDIRELYADYILPELDK